MLVIDASVVVKVLTEEAGSDLAAKRLTHEAERTAPDWLYAEVASALSKKVRYGELPIAKALQSLTAVPVIMPDLLPSAALLSSALALSIELRHALYDCLYLALAVEQQCLLLTADRKFFGAVSSSRYSGCVELLA